MNTISRELQDWLVEIRRDFHMHPETAYEEVRTTDRIASILTGLGLDVQRFDDMTGVVGLLRSGNKGRTVALLSLIHISEPTRLGMLSRMPSSA